MYTNTDITLYSLKDGAYTRLVINSVFWDDVKQSNVNKSGLTTSDSVKIFIPVGSMTVPLKFALAKDLIVKGISELVIDSTSQASISASLKALKESNEKVVTVSIVDEKLYGSLEMQHIEISCK